MIRIIHVINSIYCACFREMDLKGKFIISMDGKKTCIENTKVFLFAPVFVNTIHYNCFTVKAVFIFSR